MERFNKKKMQREILVIILLILVIVVATGSMTTAVLTAGLIANVMAIHARMHKMGSKIQITKNGSKSAGTAESAESMEGNSAEEPAQTVQQEMQNIPYEGSCTIDRYSRDPGAIFNTSDMYGTAFDSYEQYKREYIAQQKQPGVPVGRTPDELNYSMDSMATRYIQQSTRDKRAQDGFANKDVNYYRYHFGGELNDAENQYWWGRNEY